MTAEEGEEGMGVRLHVGGLARGVQAAQLAGLIARALPKGAEAPTAEIMRDSTTGIERGFGYVSIPPGGQGVKAGVERAIAAYNGTRWKGSKIHISLAKGNYMQRLRDEWEEEAARGQETAQKRQNAASSQEDRPFLRLRRRPGERVILVDPKPVPWETQTRSKAGFFDKGKGDGSVKGERRGEAEGHRRKKGVLGCRRRVTFLGGVKTWSTTCRDLWREHLQEMATDANAARKRSSVESLLMSEAQQRGSARDRTDRDIQQGGALPSPGGRRKDIDDADEEGDGDVARHLTPEEPPASEGIEFVWDMEKDEVGGTPSRSGSDDLLQEELDGELEEVGDADYDENNMKQEEEEEEGGSPDVDRLDLRKEELGERENEWTDYGDEKTVVASDQGLLIRPMADERDCEGRAAKGMGAASIRKKLSRLGRNHGLEIDDRLAEFLSDEEDADAVGGAFDYELETAERVGSTTSGTDNAAESGQEILEGMSERLQEENKRSLDLLAEVLGTAPGHSSAAPSSAPASTADPAESRLEGPETSARNGRAEKGDERSPLAIGTVAETGDTVREAKGLEKKRHRSGSGDEEDDTLAASNENIRSTADGERVRPSKAPEGDGSGAQNAHRSSLAKERFVTHMSTLTDIFRVQDKVSTKKNKEEKERDRGFKVASLFKSLAGASGGVSAPGGSSTGAGFSFSFGADRGETAGSAPEAFGGDSSGAEIERQSGGQTGLTMESNSPRTSAGPHGTDERVASGKPNDGGGDSGSQLAGVVRDPQSLEVEDKHGENEGETQSMVLWRPLEAVEAVAVRFMRSDKREDVEAAWLGERRALTHDFKRKHKDAVKGRRGFGARVGGGAKRKR